MKKPVKKMKPKIMWAVVDTDNTIGDSSALWDFKRDAISECEAWPLLCLRVAKVRITEV